MNIFSPTNVNNGILVDYTYYIDPSEASGDDIGKGVLDSINETTGISVTDMVDMMVRSKMGYKVEEKQAEITNMNIQMTALNTFKSTMTSFNSNTISALNNPNALTSYTISNTDTSSVGSTIGSDGLDQSVDMNVQVNQVAQPQTLMTSGVTDPNAPLDGGTMVIEFGDYSSGSFDPNTDIKSIAITIEDPMNLHDVANQINQQSSDVEADVVQNADGTYSLALMGTQTGEQSEMKISTTGGGTNDMFAYDGVDTATMKETQAGQDAEYVLNGVPMTSPTNNVKHMGVELTLMAVTDTPVKITSEPNTQGVSENISNFVTNYNTMIEQFNMLNEMVPDQNFIGSLHGSEISKDIEKALDSMWMTIEQSGLYMEDLGITVNSDGSLYLNESQLASNLEDDPNLANEILGSTAELSNGDAYQLVDMGDTIDGDHEIIVDTAPEKAVLTSGALTDPTTFAADTEIPMNLGGTEVTVTIPAGDYTASELAATMNNQIKIAGVDDYNVSVSDNNELVFESSEYGTLEWVEITVDVPELGFTAGDKQTGQDVKGYIDGERFIGDGTTISSTADGTDGLKIIVDPETLVLNEPVTLTTQKGALQHIDDTIVDLTDPLYGTITRELNFMELELEASSTTSLVYELGQLEQEQQMWYDFYSDYYSSLSSSLASLDETQNFLDVMFGNDSED